MPLPLTGQKRTSKISKICHSFHNLCHKQQHISGCVWSFSIFVSLFFFIFYSWPDFGAPSHLGHPLLFPHCGHHHCLQVCPQEGSHHPSIHRFRSNGYQHHKCKTRWNNLNIHKKLVKFFIFQGDILISEGGNFIPILAILYAAISSFNSVGISIYQEQLYKVNYDIFLNPSGRPKK